jgi:hypothetical protein
MPDLRANEPIASRFDSSEPAPDGRSAAEEPEIPKFLRQGLSRNQLLFRKMILKEAFIRYTHTATLIHASVAEKQMLTLLANECKEWVDEIEKDTKVD